MSNKVCVKLSLEDKYVFEKLFENQKNGEEYYYSLVEELNYIKKSMKSLIYNKMICKIESNNRLGDTSTPQR